MLKLEFMKRAIIGTLLLTTVAFGMMAQPYGKGPNVNPGGQPYYCIPNLTEQQSQQIEKLRVEHLKKMNTIRAEMEKLRAEKHALMIAEKPDQKVIDAIIDKMAAQRATMQKEQARHHLAVRALLTDEQNVYFDQKTFNKRTVKVWGKGCGPRGYWGCRYNCNDNRSLEKE